MTFKNPFIVRSLTAWAVALLIVAADQVVKYLVKTNFSLFESVEVTPWFHIFFTENTGMAFGMQFMATAFLAVFRVVAIAYFSIVLRRIIHSQLSWGILVCFSLIIAGAVGNLIDNACYGLIYTESLPFGEPAALTAWGEGYGSFLSGRVVDMFYFPFFTWPEQLPWIGGQTFFGAVFNLADAAISVGFVCLLFYHKTILEHHLFRLPAFRKTEAS